MLLGPERRKMGWMQAEAASDTSPWRQQAVLGRTHRDADALPDVVRDYALHAVTCQEAWHILRRVRSCPGDPPVPGSRTGGRSLK